MSEIEKIVSEVADVVRREANVRAVFGEPMHIDGHDLVPVATVDLTVGAGGTFAQGGTEEAEGKIAATVRRMVPFGGGGGGLHVAVTPMGWLAAENGVVVFHALDEKGAEAGGLVERILQRFGSK